MCGSGMTDDTEAEAEAEVLPAGHNTNCAIRWNAFEMKLSMWIHATSY